jgi:hypothetical protein
MAISSYSHSPVILSADVASASLLSPQTQTLRLLASLGSNLVEVEPIRDTLVVSKDK